jgi:3-phosphoshikimate 1-carboxyvinyltransferase
MLATVDGITASDGNEPRMTDPLPIRPVDRPMRGTVRPPGSKSITNRALVTAALADGTSRLSGVLDSRDTQVMIESLGRLGVGVLHDAERSIARVSGCGGRPAVPAADLWLENSGTSIRFLTALCALGTGRYRLDGNERMRQRPIRDLVDALEALGADVACESGTDCPPVLVNGCGLAGGVAAVAAGLSSQYLSALLMSAPSARETVDLRIAGDLVSEPYVEMTLAVMSAFGVTVDRPEPGRYVIEPQPYRATDYAIEPDASAASYFFAAAAITGGEVTVEGLSHDALQGDVRFVDVLEEMGCRVVEGPQGITVSGGSLRGVDVDMNAISDTAQTLAAVAVFAEGAARIRNVAHVRHKETDRVSAIVTELRRLGVEADEHPDGVTIHPGEPRPAIVQTYDDHRMAMSFALIGLRAEGIEIADPGCTAKTYPRFFDDLDRLCGGRP